jgi:MFS family permease
MGLNTLAASLGSAWLAMTYGMPLIMFMQAIGASGLMIGLVTTTRQIAMAAQIPAALATEGLRARKPFWYFCALTHRLVWFAAAAIAAWVSPEKWWLPLAIIALVAVSDSLSNASTAPWLSWMADLIPLPITGRFWGIRQSVSTVASLVGLLLASQVLDAARTHSGQATPRAFAIVFTLAAIFGVGDIIVHLFVREPRPAPLTAGSPIRRRILAPLASRDFLCLTLSLGIWNFGIAMITAFALVYLKRDFGVTYSQLASLSIAAALGAILTGYAFGEIMDRIGARILAAILYIATPLPLAACLFVNHSTVRLGPFVFPQSVALQSAAGILTGAIYAAINLCQLRLASELTAPRGRTMSMAVHWTLVGLLSALGPATGGLIMDHFPRTSLTIPSGLPLSFYHAQLLLFIVVLWLGTLPLILAVRSPIPARR